MNSSKIKRKLVVRQLNRKKPRLENVEDQTSCTETSSPGVMSV